MFRVALITCLFSTAAVADEYALLRFTAKWCQPCHAQERLYKSLKLPEKLKELGVKEYRVDISTPFGQQRSREWDVKKIPFMILVRMRDGVCVAKVRTWEGTIPKEIFPAFVDPRQSPPPQVLLPPTTIE